MTGGNNTYKTNVQNSYGRPTREGKDLWECTDISASPTHPNQKTVKTIGLKQNTTMLQFHQHFHGGKKRCGAKDLDLLATIARGGKTEAAENTRTIHQDPAPDQPAPNSCNLFPPPNLQTLRMRAAGLLS